MDKLTAYINKSMGILSMYNGMLFGLVGIWAVAVVLALTGVLSYDPLAMAASLAVLVISTGLASWLIGALYGVRAHGPSSLITGFILALIFTPSLEPAMLATLGLVGVIAGASKYILVWKGRHIFNPVAVAAVVIGLTGLAGASWWVATPPLFLVILAVTIISLYKSKHYPLVLTFLAVATPLTVLYFVTNGVDLGDSFGLLLSWPLLFFAGIMLTEPLTLPPKKWQLYAEAVIVAVIFSIPFEIGDFRSNPAVALLVGNLFAAIVANRQAITLKLKERRALTPTTDEFIFTTPKPVAFEAGQYMELRLPLQKQDLRGERRSFSMTSIPGKKEVSFGIKFYDPSSSFKQSLRTMKKGESLQVSSVSGDFTLPKSLDEKLLFVAGGIGVTPFISHLKTNAVLSESRDITLVYAVSSADEVAYLTELAASNAKIIIVSPVKPVGMPASWVHVAAPRLTQEILADVVPDSAKRIGYVSGPPTFVQGMKRSLKHLAVRKVKTDYFVGY